MNAYDPINTKANSQNAQAASGNQDVGLDEWQIRDATAALCTHAANSAGLTTAEACSSLIEALRALNAARVRN